MTSETVRVKKKVKKYFSAAPGLEPTTCLSLYKHSGQKSLKYFVRVLGETMTS